MNIVFCFIRNFFISLFFCFATLFSDGFVAGTLVKKPGGYAPIETLTVGSVVCCCDKNGAVIQRPVLATAKQENPGTYTVIRAGQESVITSPQQKFFVHNPKSATSTWVAVGDIGASSHYLISTTRALGTPISATKTVPQQEIKELAPALYNLCIAEAHNYFVTTQDFVAHNFLPTLSKIFTTAMSHSEPLTLFQIGLREIEVAGVTRWEFYYGFLTIENLLITIAAGLVIYGLYTAFKSRHPDDEGRGGGSGGGGFRYQPSNNIFCPTANNIQPGQWLTGTHDSRGNLILDERQKQEHDYRTAEMHRREQERLDNAYLEEEHRKHNEQLRLQELQQEKEANTCKTPDPENNAEQPSQDNVQAFIPTPVPTGTCPTKAASNTSKKPLAYDAPTFKIELPNTATSTTPVITLEQTNLQLPIDDSMAFGNIDAYALLQKLREVQCKQQVLDQVYQVLASPAESLQWDHARVLNQELQHLVCSANQEESFAYGQLSIALTDHMLSTTKPGPEQDFLNSLKMSTDRFVTRTHEILMKRCQDIINNPLPTLAMIAAGACISTSTLAPMVLGTAIANYEEIFAEGKKFTQLLANDPSEALAHLTAFIAECMALNKTIGLTTEAANAFLPHLAKLESLCKGFINQVRQEEALALAAQGSRTSVETPCLNALNEARQEIANKANLLESAQSTTVAESKAIEFSKGPLKHAVKKHLPEKVKNDIPFKLKKYSREAVAADIEKRSYFNKNWSAEKAEAAAKIAFDEATQKGIRGEYSTKVFSEEITVYIDKDGNFRSAWGNYKHLLSDFGY